MFCAKCKFNSFDHLPKCPKCGFDWKESREALQLAWLQSEGHDWFRPPSPKAAPDVQDAFSADTNMDFVLAPDASPTTASNVPDASLEGFSDGPLLIEEVTFVSPTDDKPTKEADGKPDGPSHQSSREAPHEPLQEPQRLAQQDMPAETPDIPGNKNAIRPLLEIFPEDGPSTGGETVAASREQTSPDSDALPVLEEIALGDDVSTEDILATWEIPDELVPKEIEESVPLSEQPDPASSSKRNETVLGEEIVYDFSAFEAAGQPSKADPSKPASPDDSPASSKDKRA